MDIDTLFCFHYAGGNASIFKNFLKNSKVKVIAIQLPGREELINESLLSSLDEATEYALNIINRYKDKSKFGLLGHSMGTWLAYSVYTKLEVKPSILILSNFPSPFSLRNSNIWRMNKNLNDIEFQQELKKWDVSELVFQEKYWKVFKNLLRSDFSLFDNKNNLTKTNIIKDVDVVLIYGTEDKMILSEDIYSWLDIIENNVFIHPIYGGKHLFTENYFTEWQNIVKKYIL